MARLQKTLTDYIVIALAPALIMTLIGSLLFFLFEVFYRGQFEGRLRVIFALFVFASVLIARISIEEGRERAILFTVPLAGVTLLAISTLVKFGGPLAGYAAVVNLGLVALTLWCADRLTWDCTVIDDQEDASGEGLLHTAGLERRGAADHDTAPRGSETQGPRAKTWWQRFLEHRRRRHAPGVWVVYVSMAALPLFGIGQRFVPAIDLVRRRFLFQLLCLFVASALGLLLTSSFLSLRRYLRQRKVEMPLGMASVWLLVGVTMIVVVLAVCAALPRPDAEYSLAHIKLPRISSPDAKPSRSGTGSEGTRPDGTPAPTTPGVKPAEQPGAADATAGKGAAGGQTDDRRGDGDSKRGGGDQGPKSAARGAGGNDQKSAGSQPEASGSGEKPAAGAQPDSSSKPPGGARGSPSEPGSGAKPSPASPPPAAGSASSPPPPPAPPPPPSSSGSSFQPLQALNSLLQFLPQLLHGAYYLIVAVIVGWLLWRYRASILPALRNFFEPFLNLWRHLFAVTPQRAAGEAAAPAAPAPPPRFADFTDPFQSGAVRQMTAAQLIVYSFQALEAWGRDGGCARRPEQTPAEFAEQIAARDAAVGAEASALADRYCSLAYSGEPPQAGADQLWRLWQVLAAGSPWPARPQEGTAGPPGPTLTGLRSSAP